MRIFKHKTCEYRFEDNGNSLGIYNNGEFSEECSNLDKNFEKGLADAGFVEFYKHNN